MSVKVQRMVKMVQEDEDAPQLEAAQEEDRQELDVFQKED